MDPPLRWRSLVKPHWLNIGFPLAILALAISCREVLGIYWLAISTCDIGFISALNNNIIYHIGNLPTTNIEPIVGTMLAQCWLKTFICLKIAGWENNKMIYKYTKITQWRLFWTKHIISIMVYHVIPVSIKR